MTERHKRRVPVRAASTNAAAVSAGGAPGGTIPPLAATDLLWIELYDAWKAAQLEAQAAGEWWRRHPGRDGYALYRAAQDRADAAQDALAGAAA